MANQTINQLTEYTTQSPLNDRDLLITYDIPTPETEEVGVTKQTTISALKNLVLQGMASKTDVQNAINNLSNTYYTQADAAILSSNLNNTTEALKNIILNLGQTEENFPAFGSFSSFSEIPLNKVVIGSVNYTNQADSDSPQPSQTNRNWKFISIPTTNQSTNSRTVQIACTPYAHNGAFYIRKGHDSTWYGWYEYRSINEIPSVTQIGTCLNGSSAEVAPGAQIGNPTLVPSANRTYFKPTISGTYLVTMSQLLLTSGFSATAGSTSHSLPTTGYIGIKWGANTTDSGVATIAASAIVNRCSLTYSTIVHMESGTNYYPYFMNTTDRYWYPSSDTSYSNVKIQFLNYN